MLNFTMLKIQPFIGKSSCTLTNYVPFRVCGLDMILLAIITNVDTNGALIMVIINWGIAIKYNGIDFTSSILKFEVPT